MDTLTSILLPHFMKIFHRSCEQLRRVVMYVLPCVTYKHLQFLSWYSMAAFKLKASMSAVSCRVRVFPTLRTSIPSVVMPTLSSGCSLMPRSMISAVLWKQVYSHHNKKLFSLCSLITFIHILIPHFPDIHGVGDSSLSILSSFEAL